MGIKDEEDIVRTERLFGLALLASLMIFSIGDIFEDLQEGSTPLHVAFEITFIILCFLASTYLWRRVMGVWSKTTNSVKNQLVAVREDARRWQEEHTALSKGLSHAIEKQLEEWGLSEAEQDVSFLLMKGFSFKEIAQLRNTSEHTVRQQAGTIYKKSELEGRAQLSAFFLEDLLTFGRSYKKQKSA